MKRIGKKIAKIKRKKAFLILKSLVTLDDLYFLFSFAYLIYLKAKRRESLAKKLDWNNNIKRV